MKYIVCIFTLIFSSAINANTIVTDTSYQLNAEKYRLLTQEYVNVMNKTKTEKGFIKIEDNPSIKTMLSTITNSKKFIVEPKNDKQLEYLMNMCGDVHKVKMNYLSEKEEEMKNAMYSKDDSAKDTVNNIQKIIDSATQKYEHENVLINEFNINCLSLAVHHYAEKRSKEDLKGVMNPEEIVSEQLLSHMYRMMIPVVLNEKFSDDYKSSYINALKDNVHLVDTSLSLVTRFNIKQSGKDLEKVDEKFKADIEYIYQKISRSHCDLLCVNSSESIYTRLNEMVGLYE